MFLQITLLLLKFATVQSSNEYEEEYDGTQQHEDTATLYDDCPAGCLCEENPECKLHVTCEEGVTLRRFNLFLVLNSGY